MVNLLRELLMKSNLYSIEISGILSFKFSINTDSKYYKKYEDIIIDFVSGCVFKDLEKNEILGKDCVFELIGLDISNCFLLDNNIIEIVLDDKYSIKSKNDNFELMDIQWMLKGAKGNFSIANNGHRIIIHPEV